MSGTINVTQLKALAVVHVTAPLRVTQLKALVVVRSEKPGCDTSEADLWKITREDGTVYRFTSHSRRMTFRNEVYSPCGSLSASTLNLSAELGSTDNVDLSGIIFEGGITELDLWSGKFFGAAIEVWRAPWSGDGVPVLLMQGTVSNTKFEDQPFTFEVVTPGERLQERAVLQQVTPSCRFKTYDGRCGLSEAAFVETGAVTSVAAANLFTGAARREFGDTSRVEADDFFTLGKLTWTSGDNNGRSVDVKTYSVGHFVLSERMAFPVQLGDTYSVLPGDDHSFETCTDKFANAINFGGFPKLRGTDDLNEQGKS